MFKRKESEKKTEKQKVEERREEVLKSGRKFKYPLQYAKHKTMLISIIVGILALVGLGAGGYYALYKANSTNDILYRLTTVLPIPVAKVDGDLVRYSDYLLIYKSTITPIEQQQGKLGDDETASAMRAHYQRTSLTNAENYAYAEKLARELGVTVSDADIDAAIATQRKVGGIERSEESFEKLVKDKKSTLRLQNSRRKSKRKLGRARMLGGLMGRRAPGRRKILGIRKAPGIRKVMEARKGR